MMASLITGDNNTPLESDMSADTEHVMKLVLAQRLSTFHLCRLACVSKALHTVVEEAECWKTLFTAAATVCSLSAPLHN